jgi:hypothetical protein
MRIAETEGLYLDVPSRFPSFGELFRVLVVRFLPVPVPHLKNASTRLANMPESPDDSGGRMRPERPVLDIAG